MRFVTASAAFLFAAALLAQSPPHLRLRAGHQSAERSPADSSLLAADARLLVERKFSALTAEARSGNKKRSQAARLVLLGSGDPAFVPLLLERLDARNSLDAPIAQKAVELYPAAAWPVLVRMANEGSTAAVDEIYDFEGVGQPEILRLTRSPRPAIRAAAIGYVEDWNRIEAALDDSEEVVLRSAVRRLVSAGDSVHRDFVEDARPKVRALFAELTPPWTKTDMNAWVRLAGDPSPQVRQWAVLHLAPLGLAWGHGGWTPAGIAAIRRAILDGPAAVRRNAILAARGWMLEWEKIDRIWSPEEIAAARAVFRLPAFRTAVRFDAARDRIEAGTNYADGIQFAPAQRALALSGDSQALKILTSRLEMRPWEHPEVIASLGFVPGRDTEAYLWHLVDMAAHRPALPQNQANDYEADVLFGTALQALKDLGVRDFGRALKLMASRKTPVQTRVGLAGSLAPLPGKSILQGLLELASDRTLPGWARMQVVYDLVESPDPKVPALLERLSASTDDENVKRAVENALHQLQKKKSASPGAMVRRMESRALQARLDLGDALTRGLYAGASAP